APHMSLRCQPSVGGNCVSPTSRRDYSNTPLPDYSVGPCQIMSVGLQITVLVVYQETACLTNPTFPMSSICCGLRQTPLERLPRDCNRIKSIVSLRYWRIAKGKWFCWASASQESSRKKLPPP